MKKFCILFTMIFSLSILTACSTQPVETTTASEQTTGETVASTTETAVDTTTEPPITPVNPWKTAVYGKESWWENTVALTSSLENASAGSLIIANNILTQENDAMLVVEAYVVSDNLKTMEDRYEFFSSLGFEVFANKEYYYGLKTPLLLASKEQLLSISFPKDYKVGFNLAFAAKAFYEELPVSSYQSLNTEHEENHEYIIYLSLKNPSGHFYVSPEEARRLWPIVYEKHPLLPRPSWQDESDTSLTLAMTEKKLYELLASDGFFDDFEVAIAYSRPGM